jgi:hypothetical protein
MQPRLPPILSASAGSPPQHRQHTRHRLLQSSNAAEQLGPIRAYVVRRPSTVLYFFEWDIPPDPRVDRSLRFDIRFWSLSKFIGGFAGATNDAQFVHHLSANRLDVGRVEHVLLIQESRQQEPIADQVDAARDSLGEGENGA